MDSLGNCSHNSTSLHAFLSDVGSKAARLSGGVQSAQVVIHSQDRPTLYIAVCAVVDQLLHSVD